MKMAVSILAVASVAVLTALAISTEVPAVDALGDPPAADRSSAGPAPAAPQENAPSPQPSPVQSGMESEQLGQVADELAQLRQQVAAEESQRQDENAEEAARHEATRASLDILRQAEASLASGDSDDVDDELVRAETALSGRTRLDVEAAREALSRSDLFPAREYLAAALAENRK